MSLSVKHVFAGLAVLSLVCPAAAERVEKQLADWLCNGEKVIVPHTWNAIDGADVTVRSFRISTIPLPDAGLPDAARLMPRPSPILFPGSAISFVATARRSRP